MTRIVSARDANQQFSDILGEAADGETVIITRRGTPVAKLVPYTAPADEGAWDRLLAMLEEGLPLGGGTFSRDELYEDR
ncbi:type II toxin-antitoxin system Phd/YefM family antitoxin [Nitrospirillum viridazoti]|uniref:Antitoxin n=2 Tax=Nitrospirillum TaxID=1543705 RepID=A0A248JX74_9PROT|nr:type II toxin-antitoxin system Phd/YefM family antitoxin [Nitrospirillum amazonense]ASG23322.1 type II toxin-antitoxin system prevent-host-death family antitoxin [Nitrospirillum amazonense CBAmc]TWB40009.1 prevent-host-death family protein [Nitrospirillum amazonense]TWB56031.1 prevent-host-death family protein [Nitrospirillum amazonense]